MRRRRDRSRWTKLSSKPTGAASARQLRRPQPFSLLSCGHRQKPGRRSVSPATAQARSQLAIGCGSDETAPDDSKKSAGTDAEDASSPRDASPPADARLPNDAWMPADSSVEPDASFCHTDPACPGVLGVVSIDAANVPAAPAVGEPYGTRTFSLMRQIGPDCSVCWGGTVEVDLAIDRIVQADEPACEAGTRIDPADGLCDRCDHLEPDPNEACQCGWVYQSAAFPYCDTADAFYVCNPCGD